MDRVNQIFTKMGRAVSLLALTSIVAFAAFTAQALPGPTGFTFDKGAMFTVAGYAVDKPSLTGFPVLVRIAANSPSGFSYDDLHSKSTGDDIAFVGMDGGGLPFEIDTWDPDGTSLIWVQLPTMANGTQFVMCWGSDTSGKTVCGDNPWSDYTGVWHMGETGTPSDSAPVTIHDSTTNDLDGSTPVGGAASGSVIGGAWRVAPNNDHAPAIHVPATSGTAKAAADALGTDFHASFWFRAKGDVPWSYLVSRRKGEQGSGWGFLFHSGTPPTLMRVHAGSKSYKNTSDTYNLGATLCATNDVWKKVDVVWRYDVGNDKQYADIYLNGAYLETVTCNETVKQENADIGIGCSTQDSYSDSGAGKGRRVNGEMDEVRLGAFVPSADWIAADYATQSSSGSFLTAGVAEPYVETANPVAGVSVSGVGYTNATVTATVVSLGSGATSAVVTVELSESNDFASTVWTTQYTVNADNDVHAFSPPGLAFGMTYYVRAVVENSEHATLTTPAVSFTTQTPGTPAVAAETGVIGFSSFSVVALPTDIGTGGENVTLWLDVSAAGDFSDTLSFGGVETNAVPASIPLVATGLANGTAYAARVRAVNVWGLEAVSPMLSITTRAEPVEMAVPTAVFAGNGVETLAIAPVDIEMGATYSVSLAVDGSAVREWSGLSGLEPLSVDWPGVAGYSHVAVFTVVSSFGGMNWTREYQMSFMVGSTAFSIGNLTELDAMLFRVGDTFVIPALAPGDSIVYATNACLSVSGTTFIALEPGISRIFRYATDPVTGDVYESETGVVIIAPKASDMKGGLFVRRTGDSNFNWRDASSWEKISGDGEYPNAPGDVALVYLPLTADKSVYLGNDTITLGYLGVGSALGNHKIIFREGNIVFDTGCGGESWIRLSGHVGGDMVPVSFSVPVSLANDLAIDGMGRGWLAVTFDDVVSIGGHTLRTTRVPVLSTGGYVSGSPSGQFQFNKDITGTGTILHEANATTSIGSSKKSFTGKLDWRNGSHDGNYGAAGLYLGTGSRVGNISSAAELDVRGAWMSDNNLRRGATFKTGWSNAYQHTSPTNLITGRLPRKIVLDGGLIRFITNGPLSGDAASAYQATGIRDDYYETDEFRIATGSMGHLGINISTWHNGLYPNTHTVFTNLVAEPFATASFSLSTTYTPGENPTITNEFRIVNSPAAAWDSGKGYEILPFFFVNAETQNRYITVRDTSTGLVTNVTPDSTADSTGNIREIGSNGKNGAMEDGSTWEAVTVYPWAYAYFSQPNSTVKILSGYLNVVSKPFAPPDHANSASSTVDFGDRTAYVYVNRQSDTADIGCRVAGTAGFVKSAGGTLQLHQPMDGLSGGVCVGAGRLSLLDDATLGDNDVSIAAGAKLRIVGGNPFGSNVRLDLENRDWISTTSRLELDNGEENRVRRLYVNGVCQKRGTYGATGSGAEFIDDAIFSGTGVLKVLRDDLAMPLVIRMK